MAVATGIRARYLRRAEGAADAARRRALEVRPVVLGTTLVALVIAVAVVWHLGRTVVEPIRRLTASADAMRRGDIGQRIDVKSHDEIGELAASFNQMALDLAEFRRTNIGEVVRAKNALEATLEVLPDAVVLLDEDARIQARNRTAARVLAAAGLDAPQRLQDPAVLGLDIDMATAVVNATAGAVPSPDLARAIRVEIDGSVHRLLPRVVPMPTSNPSQRGAVLLLYDVTELARLDEMRSELVGVASHELQRPLTTLRMTLLMLDEASLTLPPRVRELVATSLLGAQQLSDVVREYLDLTRIEAGHLRLNREPVPLPR